jgi:hypothetical protein
VEAQAWTRRNSPSRNELAFLQASQRRRLQFGISVLAIVVVLLASAGLTAWYRWQLPPDPTRVTTLQDSGTGSLRWAIANAPPGSTITFDASLQGTLRLTDVLHMSKQLTIHGPGAGRVTMNGDPIDEFGVAVSPPGSVTMTGLAFTSSSLYNSGTLTLINSTISDNSAQRLGGGILNATTSAQMEMIFCTVYGNTSGEGGGGIWNGATNSSSQLLMRNSLVAENKSPSGPDIQGSLTSQGYNLIQKTQDTIFAPSQAHGTDLLQVAPSALGMDPLLKDNNGTSQTHALLSGSAAIDRIPPSDCRIKDISTDQRGVRRPQGVRCDIGVYELRE